MWFHSASLTLYWILINAKTLLTCKKDFSRFCLTTIEHIVTSWIDHSPLDIWPKDLYIINDYLHLVNKN